MSFGTAQTILSQAANELGLTSYANMVTASDNTSVQLLALLNKVGRELVKEDWKALIQQLVVTTDGVTNPISLPADFRSIVDQTAWDRSQRYPMVGPLTAQQWEKLVASVALVAVGTPFRLWQNKLYLYPLTGFPAGRVLAMEYDSSYWVVVSPATAPGAETIVNSTDTIWIDRELMVAALKVAWKREKGFDTTAAEQDYEQALAAARDDDADGQVLNAGGLGPAVHLIDSRNLPDTGWGG